MTKPARQNAEFVLISFTQPENVAIRNVSAIPTLASNGVISSSLTVYEQAMAEPKPEVAGIAFDPVLNSGYVQDRVDQPANRYVGPRITESDRTSYSSTVSQSITDGQLSTAYSMPAGNLHLNAYAGAILNPTREAHAKVSPGQPLPTGPGTTLNYGTMIKAPIRADAQNLSGIASLIEQGRTLEGQRRWGEALALYESALHDEALYHRPCERQLDQRINLARIHCDLGRRYVDNSFRKAAATLTEAESLDIFTQILLTIDTHYVQTPNWPELFDHGTLALETALNEPAFTGANLQGVSAERIEAFRQDLRRGLASRPIRDRQGLRKSAEYAARLGLQQLGLSPTVTVLEYTCGVAGGLDEYSAFLSGDQLNDVYSQIKGNYVGLGIELKAHESSPLIVNVITGSPAEKEGLKPGDQIQSINNRSTEDLTSDQAAALLQGEKGSIVQLIAVTGSDPPRPLKIRREHIDVSSIERVKIADANNGVGYLKISCFQKTTSRDLDAALSSLHHQGMRSLIIDLRGNPGGLLTAGVEVAGTFIEQGSIVSTRGRNPHENFTYRAHKVGTWDVPLVLLIDSDSASAAEIFAGAIRDQHRGTIVGVRSYGKGSVQSIFPLNVAGFGVRLTTAKFYSPNGTAYSNAGVEADVEIRQTAKLINSRKMLTAQMDDDDPALVAGIQVARRDRNVSFSAAAQR